ncbi:hypothetical protein JRO89_XS12G0007300 [Xanthoceras sorbifolium]|uniref:Pleiotropic ABC efflux transporter N-terminal domain-containing protein n=1 Tax=Xanthoceras sorbifolium TaxID=99658 RepID=A0ABQ8HA75_9ROSI|nr:hypothetical protein JRO89_XS12G0007300 [Xanthoceras sorbifolium]
MELAVWGVQQEREAERRGGATVGDHRTAADVRQAEKVVLRQVLDNGKVVHGEVDVTNLGMQDKKQLMESILKVVEEDNEKFLRRLRDRTDRVGIEIPKIEVRYEHLSVEGDVHVACRALPTLINVYILSGFSSSSSCSPMASSSSTSKGDNQF